ncbi:hypothetical protein SAMN05920897_1222 [Alkalispirochaeta americana]|uniref:Uncharacterized protein n=1 Tax=Alkalispirochaeta americana TaxID=159291 RepID=A0A1N6XAL1_9SPIO|nr:hypothetical protein [Alkalispirochaeta americana]SIQ99385.1 hypothetical protein SAMN05920897_1222 [Alkalispirochaeta americana]
MIACGNTLASADVLQRLIQGMSTTENINRTTGRVEDGIPDLTPDKPNTPRSAVPLSSHWGD